MPTRIRRIRRSVPHVRQRNREKTERTRGYGHVTADCYCFENRPGFKKPINRETNGTGDENDETHLEVVVRLESEYREAVDNVLFDEGLLGLLPPVRRPLGLLPDRGLVLAAVAVPHHLSLGLSHALGSLPSPISLLQFGVHGSHMGSLHLAITMMGALRGPLITSPAVPITHVSHSRAPERPFHACNTRYLQYIHETHQSIQCKMSRAARASVDVLPYFSSAEIGRVHV